MVKIIIALHKISSKFKHHFQKNKNQNFFFSKNKKTLTVRQSSGLGLVGTIADEDLDSASSPSDSTALLSTWTTRSDPSPEESESEQKNALWPTKSELLLLRVKLLSELSAALSIGLAESVVGPSRRLEESDGVSAWSLVCSFNIGGLRRQIGWGVKGKVVILMELCVTYWRR